MEKINCTKTTEGTMNLENYFFGIPHRKINKWFHYFEIYDRHFSKFREVSGRNRSPRTGSPRPTPPVIMLEIGIQNGGSIDMWRNYFSKRGVIIYGIDIDERCRVLNNPENDIHIRIGSQEDPLFLTSVLNEIISNHGRLDILLDDGGHTMNQQITTFNTLFDHIHENGVYLCEDTHTSYWHGWNGGLREPGTFIEYMKDKIDELNGYHHSVTQFTKTSHSIHFYDSIVVIEKRIINPPRTEKRGIVEICDH